jgi:cell division protein FtsQ
MPSVLRDRSRRSVGSGADASEDATEDATDVTSGGTPVDPRIRARRSAIARARRARRRRRLAVVLVIISVAVAGYAVSRSPLLSVHAVDVQAGPHVTDEAVRAATGIADGLPMTGVSVDDVTQRVEAIPWVDTATVTRRWPRTVAVSITERRPAAVLDDGQGGWLLIDGTGRVLGPTPPIAPSFGVHVDGIPAVTPGQDVDRRVQGALALIQRLTPNLKGRVQTIHVNPDGTVEVHIYPTGTVVLGRPDDALDAKIRSLQAVLAQADLTNLCRVDLRVPDSPVLTRSTPCA